MTNSGNLFVEAAQTLWRTVKKKTKVYCLFAMFLITLALLALLVGLLYTLMTWNFNYWKKKGVPGPEPKLFIGNYPNLFSLKKHMIYDIDNIYSTYKQKHDAVGIYGGRNPQLLVLSPELARRVLVSDFKNFHDNELSLMVDEKSDFIFGNNPFTLTGEKWKQRRADVTPGLTMGRIKTVYPVTNKVCKKMSDYIRKQIRIGAKDGLETKDLSLCFTSEVVTDCVLGLSAESFSDNPTPILSNIKALFEQSFAFLLYFIIVSTLPALRHIKKMRFIPLKVEHFFTDLMQTAIDARQAQQASEQKFQRTDFLDYLLQLGKKKDLGTRHLMAHTMTFLLDGFETTAAGLAHLLLLLGRDEQAQQKLRDEIKAQLEKDEGIINFEKLNELPYLDACVQESLRLFPPAFVSNKLCTENIELPNKNGPNFTVEKGTTVIVPHYSLMNDEEHFPNAQAFQPERFMEQDAAKRYREQGTCMPFSDGPRICIGMRFALAQIKAAVVELITNFDISVNEKTRKDNLYDPKVFFARLEGGVWLNFKERQ